MKEYGGLKVVVGGASVNVWLQGQDIIMLYCMIYAHTWGNDDVTNISAGSASGYVKRNVTIIKTGKYIT